MSLAITNTTFGAVSRDVDRTVVSADGNTLRDWATRGDCAWPCSALAQYDEVTATFVDGDLVELAVIESGRDSEAEDLAADELNAWLLADVEHLAEAVVETIERLHAAGLARHAANLERALALAGGGR